MLNKNIIIPGKIIDIISFIIWFYIILNFFIIDLEIIIINYLVEDVSFFFYFRIIFTLLFLIFLFTILNKKSAISFLLYTIFFPIIILFWRLPKYIYLNEKWNLIFILFSFIFQLFSSFRLKLFLLFFFIISVLTIVFSDNHYLLSLSIILLILLVLIIYIRKFHSLFKSSNLTKGYSVFIENFEKNSYPVFKLGYDLSKISIKDLSDKQYQSWLQKLESTVLYNRLFLFISKKFGEYLNTKLYMLFIIINIISLMILTIVCFFMINLSLYKLNSYAFLSNEEFSIFDIFLYTVTTLFSLINISGLVPNNIYSEIVYIILSMLGYFMLIIFIGLFIKIKGQREESDISNLVAMYNDEARKLEILMSKELQVSNISDAISELERAESALIKFFLKISSSSKSSDEDN